MAYSPDTLRKYFNAVVQNMKHRCSQAKLQFGPDNETLSKMAYHLHKLASSGTQEGLEPDNLSNLKTLPLFGTLGFIPGHHLDPSKTLFDEGATATAPLTVLEQKDSLFTINDCLLKSHALKAASMRAQLNATRLACGHGGEVKFINYRKMHFEPKFSVLMVRWYQPKQIQTSLASFFINFLAPQNCFFHALGCMWLMNENPLSQPSLSPATVPDDYTKCFVFQDLQRISDKHVARRLSEAIQENVCQQHKSLYTAKSLRIGATTEMNAHPRINYEEAVSTGGWATGTSLRFYARDVLSLSLPAARMLADWPDPRSHYCPLPTQDCLLPEELALVSAWEKYVLGKIDIPEFKDPTPKEPLNGRLLPLKKLIITLLLMHYEYIC